ncbi:MAG TPA: hypothetical protein VKZ58_07395, partial [Longimicrobiales bacterium]|nr:hypothetical protein [Longimicrobiales bacterium]
RPNSYKGGRTPWPIVGADRPGIRPEVLALPPVLLEAEYQRLSRVGQDIPGLDGGRHRAP